MLGAGVASASDRGGMGVRHPRRRFDISSGVRDITRGCHHHQSVCNPKEGSHAEEFKEIAMRGYVVDMASGIIIGAAFGLVKFLSTTSQAGQRS
jgi:hypothetical protein